jgi:hypothetical protein
MSEPPLLPALVCQRCGATNPPQAVKCWLCERRDNPNPFADPLLAPVDSSTAVVQTGAQSRVQLVFLGLLGLCIAAAVLIGVGIAVQEPGLLIPYAIVIGPAFLATGVRAALMIGRKEQPKPSTLFLTFLWSGVFTALVLVLIVMASVIAFFLWCFHMLTTT